jgi:hypothetical protein
MRIIGIGGEPASGKTTLMRGLLSLWLPGGPTPGNDFSYRSVRALHIPQHKVFVVGTYAGTTFDGTDRLSMSVQPQFEMMLLWLSGKRRFDDYTVIFEGDRLFNSKTIRRCPEFGPCLWIVLSALPGMLKERHQARGDAQTERFLRSRETKIARLISAFQGSLECHPNWDEKDQALVIQRILSWMERPSGKSPPRAG